MMKGGAMSDVIDHPSHYTQGRFEVIEIIEDALTSEGGDGYCAGNVIKYLMRYRHKNGIEDLKKARWYLNRLIRRLEEPDGKCESLREMGRRVVRGDGDDA